jgi:AcrR family transcriptional regulator
LINEKKTAAHAGRPRNPKVDGALLDAALEVFLERGYHGASLTEIARRAGVGTPAIYRRWRTKAEVGVDVVRRQAEPSPVPDTGSIRNDLVSFVRQRIRMFGGRFFHYVLFPLVTDPELSATVQARFLDYRQPLEERIRTAIESGDLRPNTDPGRLLDVLMGPIIMPLLFSAPLPSRSDAESIVDQALEGFGAARAIPPAHLSRTRGSARGR